MNPALRALLRGLCALAVVMVLVALAAGLTGCGGGGEEPPYDPPVTLPPPPASGTTR